MTQRTEPNHTEIPADHLAPEQLFADALAAVQKTLDDWEARCDEARKRLAAPDRLAELVEDLLIAAGNPELLWPPERYAVVKELTNLARAVEINLREGGQLLNAMHPYAMTDALRRVLSIVEKCDRDADRRHDGDEVKPLPTLFELAQGAARSAFVARVYGWFTPEGRPDERRAIEAMEAFRRGEPVRHPSKVRMDQAETRVVGGRHPGVIQFIADMLVQIREERHRPTLRKTYIEEVDETMPQAEMAKALAR